MIKSKLAHFSLIIHDGSVRAVVRFNDTERARAAQQELGFGRVRAAQLSVGGQQLTTLYKRIPGERDPALERAMERYESTYPARVGDPVDVSARHLAVMGLVDAYTEALAAVGVVQ